MKNILIISIAMILSAPLLLAQQGDYHEEIRKYRQERIKELTGHERAPLDSSELQYVSYFEPTEVFRLSGTFVPSSRDTVISMSTYSGKQKDYRKYGRLLFRYKGKKYSLTVYQSMRYIDHPEYGEYLFLPFKDASNSEETYGGGRYIDLRIPDTAEGYVKLDFNKAYNPWCAYSDGYNCPVPPLENHLSFEVLAGEKMYQKPADEQKSD